MTKLYEVETDPAAFGGYAPHHAPRIRPLKAKRVRKPRKAPPPTGYVIYEGQCASCLLCGGAAVKAKSIAIVAHGSGAKYHAAT